MANTKSAQKRVRQIKVQTADNKAVKTRVKSARKAVLQALENEDSAAAAESYRAFSSAADRAVKSNVLHRNSVSRQKSALSRRVKSLGS